MTDSKDNARGRGTTTIADSVVAKIAALSAREVTGVHALGGAASQAMGAVRRRVGGSNVTQGVSVEVGQTQATVDLSIVVDYGHAIHKLAQDMREHVVSAVEKMTGLEVTEVNITVNDVYLEGSEDDNDDGSDEGSSSSGRRPMQ